MTLTATVRRLARRGQVLVPRARRGVHVLAYHLAGAGTSSPVDLPWERFRAQMEELAESALVVPLPEAMRALAEGSGRKVTVVLTFDDAYRNFAARAFPLLAELGLPSTLYVPTGFIDSEIAGPLAGARDLPAASWDELRELAASGLVTLGSHTRTHPSLPGLPRPEIRKELEGSKARLEERLGLPVEHFAYPRARWSRVADAEVRTLYRSAAVAGGALNRPAAFDPWRISRIPVRRDMPERLAPVLARLLCLEEAVASRLRRLRG